METQKIPTKQELSQIILRDGIKIRHNDVTLLYLKSTHTGKPAIISSISKKVSKLATSRNRLRRQLRGILQHHAKEILPNYHWMWICKTQNLTKETQELFISELQKLHAS